MRVVFVNRYFYPDLSATSQMLSDLACRLGQQGVASARGVLRPPLSTIHARNSFRREIGQRRSRSPHQDLELRTSRSLGRALDYASFYVTASYAGCCDCCVPADTVVAKTDPPLISIVVGADRPAARRASGELAAGRVSRSGVASGRESAAGLARQPAIEEHCAITRCRWRRPTSVLGTRMREHLEALQHSPESAFAVIENWADGDAVLRQSGWSRASCGRASVSPINSWSPTRATWAAPMSSRRCSQRGRSGLRSDAGHCFSHDRRRREDGGAASGGQLSGSCRTFVFCRISRASYCPDSLAAADVHLACLLPQLEGLIVPSKFYGILAAGRPTIFIGDTDGDLGRIIRATQCGASVAVGDADALLNVILATAGRQSHARADGFASTATVRRKIYGKPRYTAVAGGPAGVGVLS